METLLHTLFFFLLVTQICFAQWYRQNPLTTQNTLNDVTLFDENNGWAVGDSGIIIKTTNGGLDWSTQQSNIAHQLRAVCFVDINNGWAVGENGTILKTSDGGSNWIVQTSGVTDNLNDISFTNINKGLVVGEQGRVIRTDDGGNTWIAQTLSSSFTINGVCLVDDNNGWLVGDIYPDGVIKRTTDGGNTWITQLSPINIQESLYDVCFLDISTGWIVGRNHDGTNPWGEILKTTNGGSTWFAQRCPTAAELSSVYFIDQNNGWATAADRWYGIINGHILKTTDGGVTWLIHYLGVSKPTNGIFFKNSTNGITVGERGTIQLSTDGGDNWNSPPSSSANDWTDVFFSSPNNGLVIGDGGTILRTTNGGTNWTSVITGTTNDFMAMSFVNANEGWAVTGIIHGFHTELRDSSFIFHTTDGGAIWTKQLTMPLTLFNDVSFVDANIGWAVGIRTDSIWWTSSYPIMLRTINGGLSWSQTNLDSFPLPIKIQFINANTGWMLCNSPGMGCWGGLFKTSDGGNTWILSLDYCRNDFQFSDINNGIAVAGVHSQLEDEWGILSKTTDGGETWSSDSIYSPAYDVFYIDSNTVVTIGHHYGDQVICYWSTDAGSTWNPRPTGIYEDIHHIFFIDEQNGWMIGNNGVIYHTTNSGNPVPVELSSLTVTANDKEIVLTWSTAIELNNQGFEVQRKFDPNDFVTIGSVKGHGTTTSPSQYTYVDKLLTSGKYFYRLKQIDFGGKYEYSQTVEINWSPFTTYKLEQNYPNPFNPTTTIGFGIMEKGNVRLSVLNILGEEIKVLLNEEKETGYHSIDFSARGGSAYGGNASDLPSGVYFYRIQSGNFIDTKKMILLR